MANINRIESPCVKIGWPRATTIRIEEAIGELGNVVRVQRGLRIGLVDFEKKLAQASGVPTHAEYDKGRWKN